MTAELDQVVPRAVSTNAHRDLAPPLAIEGLVVHGDRRGRELGFPTANVLAPASIGQLEGVFIGAVERADGSIYRSAISIGRRETFYGGDAPSLVEAHLIDFTGDLYGERLVLVINVKLREQEHFSSIGELIRQIELDVETARGLIPLPGAEARESSPSVR